MSPTTDSNARPGIKISGRTSRQDDVIVEAAWYYYHDGLNQSEIAKRLDVSRASVVNYLTEARRRDYVRITLDSEVFSTHQLASELKSSFGLVDALVVPADQSAEHRTVERVIRVASDWLPQLLQEGDTLGVAWGETIYRLAEVAPKLSLPDLTILQLLGSKPSEIGFAAENCAGALAQRFGAQCINLHVPLLLSNAELCNQLKAEPTVARQLGIIDACQKVIFACGTVDPKSHLAKTGLLSDAEMDDMRAKGAAGVICGRVIDREGNPLQSPNETQMIGITLEQMRQKKTGILVSAGSERIPATLAALKGGYASHLVTSSDIANQLLADNR